MRKCFLFIAHSVDLPNEAHLRITQPKENAFRYINVFRKAIALFSLIFIGLMLLSSCQVEKRRYVDGFFINKPFSNSSASNRNIKSNDSSGYKDYEIIAIAEQEQQDDENFSVNSQIAISETCTLNKPKIDDHTRPIEKPFVSKIISTAKSLFLKETSVLAKVSAKTGKRILHPYVYWAFASVIIGVLQLAIAIRFGGGLFFFYLFYIFLIFAWILLQISRVKTKKDPDYWKGIDLINFLLVSLAVIIILGLFSIVLLRL